MFVDQVPVKGDVLTYHFSLSYINNNVLNQNSLMIIMYSFRQYCLLSELQPKSATHPSLLLVNEIYYAARPLVGTKMLHEE